MKISFFVLSATLLVTACNSGPKTTPESKFSLGDSLRFATDTTGLAEYQAWKAQNELGNPEGEQEEKASSSATQKKKATTNKTSDGDGSTGTSGTTSSESGNTAKAKKGWSKTAKGAVIGGVLGAGAGAIIGNEMDKKDGRH